MSVKRTSKGVTLIELLITVAIVGILAAIGYPSYQNQVMRSHRSEAQSALLEVQVAQEKFFLQNNAYAPSLDAANLGLGYSSATPYTRNSYYQLSLSRPTTTTYTVTATAKNGQANDSQCATLTITETGQRGGSSAECW